jgi:large subunit ribosomal protein L22
LKVVESAAANAENNFDLNPSDLKVCALIEQSTPIKRFRAAARGSAHSYKKHLSHIRIVLTTKSQE